MRCNRSSNSPRATTAEELESEGTKDVGWLIGQAQCVVEAAAHIVKIESQGITEDVKAWRTDTVARIINALGLQTVMFDAADSTVFEWYIENYGNESTFFVVHSQIVQLRGPALRDLGHQ